MKMAPLLRAFKARSDLPRAVLVHTGQHYDFALNERLFEDLQLPSPDVNLEVGSGSHAVQTAEVMKRFEPIIDEFGPCCVMVVGDVNSTLACSLVAAKKLVPVAHVEAGLRSFDRTMPEEVNRVLTDQIADLLYTTEHSALANLVREGIAPDRVQFVGNLMIDSLFAALPKSVTATEVLKREGFDPQLAHEPSGYGVVTLHRPSNVDEPGSLSNVLGILRAVSEQLPLIWPVHPRTRASIERLDLAHVIDGAPVVMLPPQGYLEMVGLMRGAQAGIDRFGRRAGGNHGPGYTLLDDAFEYRTADHVGPGHQCPGRVGSRPRIRGGPQDHVGWRQCAGEYPRAGMATRRSASLPISPAGSLIVNEPRGRHDERPPSCTRHQQCADDRRRGLLPGVGARPAHRSGQTGIACRAGSSATSINCCTYFRITRRRPLSLRWDGWRSVIPV